MRCFFVRLPALSPGFELRSLFVWKCADREWAYRRRIRSHLFDPRTSSTVGKREWLCALRAPYAERASPLIVLELRASNTAGAANAPPLSFLAASFSSSPQAFRSPGRSATAAISATVSRAASTAPASATFRPPFLWSWWRRNWPTATSPVCRSPERSSIFAVCRAPSSTSRTCGSWTSAGARAPPSLECCPVGR